MAGDNVTTVDVTELPLPRLTQLKQDLDSVNKYFLFILFLSLFV